MIKIDLNILLHRRQYLGIRGIVGVWTHNFLTNHKQETMINESNVTGGMP